MSSPIENMKPKHQPIARSADESAEGLRNLRFLCALLLGIAASSSVAQNPLTRLVQDSPSPEQADSSPVASTKADPSAEASAEAEDLARRAMDAARSKL